MEEIKKQINDILEVVNFMKDNMATKDDISRLDGRIDGLGSSIDRIDGSIYRLDGSIDRIDGSIDRIDGSIDRIDGSIDYISREVDSIKETVLKLEKRTIEDSDVFAKDTLDLQRRVDKLEKQVGINKLQVSHS